MNFRNILFLSLQRPSHQLDKSGYKLVDNYLASSREAGLWLTFIKQFRQRAISAFNPLLFNVDQNISKTAASTNLLYERNVSREKDWKQSSAFLTVTEGYTYKMFI